MQVDQSSLYIEYYIHACMMQIEPTKYACMHIYTCMDLMHN